MEKLPYFIPGTRKAKNGVGIIVSNKIARRVQKVLYIDDRIIMLRISMLPKDLVIVQVYMPTTEYGDEDVDRVYENINSAIEEEENCCKIIMGDWNAVVGEGMDGKEVGRYGLGKRNKRGDRLVEFCREKKLVVTNTMYKNHKRRRYTWISPIDKTHYQIDHILIEERYKNAIKKANGLPGADINSDHVLLMTEMKIKLKKLRRAKTVRKWNMDKIKEEIKGTLGEKLNEAIKEGKIENENSEEVWKRIKTGMIKIAKEEVGYYEGKRAKKPWITEEMLGKMKQRRKYKSMANESGKVMYRKLNNELRRETQKAKEKWLTKECEDIEGLEKKGQYDIMYRKVKNISWDAGKVKGRIREIEDKEGRSICGEEEVKERWKQYVMELYKTEDKPEELKIEEEGEVDEECRGASILMSEIQKAIREMKTRKATGVDELPIELFKCLSEEGLAEIVHLCNKIYETGKWPDDFLKTIMIPIPKKTGTRKCSEFRTVSLITHAAKIMLRVLNRRMKRIMEENSGEEQFGFRSGKGTRDAIGLLRMIGERYVERGKGIYFCFMDLEKAFDRVNWEKMMQILNAKHVDWKDKKLIKELYINQKAAVRVNEEMTEWVKLGRGVRQGCCLSPTLFNIYIEDMITNVLQERKEGISIGGKKINCIRFADDMVLVAENSQTLQGLVTLLENGMEDYSMKINVKKTKVMVVNNEENVMIRAKDGIIERVKRYRYLGSLITDDWRSILEIKGRIAMAKDAFNRKKNLLCSTGLNLQLRKRLVKCYVWSVLMYGSEAWTMGKRERDRIEAFEMWVWRRMEKIRWVNKVKNEEVLNRVKEGRTLLREIQRRKGSWLGHVLRGSGILTVALEGSVNGSVKRGRRRIKLEDEIKVGSYQAMKKMACDRDGWRQRWRNGPANRQNTT